MPRLRHEKKELASKVAADWVRSRPRLRKNKISFWSHLWTDKAPSCHAEFVVNCTQVIESTWRSVNQSFGRTPVEGGVPRRYRRGANQLPLLGAGIDRGSTIW